jgi:large-conductance mechanosensitive channel
VVSINRVVGFLVLALVIFYIVTQPRSAAHTAQSIGHTLRNAAESVTVFFSEVT